MSKIIAVASQKGGVAKSTTCRNVATILAKEGHKVLAIFLAYIAENHE